MRLCSIASGSSGNCIYVGSDNTHLLVDVGISKKRTEEGLAKLGLKGQDIDGILITHEHIDHVNGLGVMSRKYGIPIYATRGTIQAIKGISSLGKIDETLFSELRSDEKFMLKDIEINPVHISHDAADPVAYSFLQGDKKCAVVTDLGIYDDYIIDALEGVGALCLEANHDINMLQVGPYPYRLKQRILGKKGHLSNELSGKFLNKLINNNLKAVTLSHLSKENNLEELAYETVRLEITMGESKYQAGDFPIFVAKRNEVSEIVEI